VNATNTGIAGKGLVSGDLTPQAGTTVNTPGTTFLRRRFTSTVTVAADNVTFRECLFTHGGGSLTRGINHTAGANLLVEDCTIVPSSGSWYFGIALGGGDDTIIRRCDISNCENNLLIESDDVLLEFSYLHDSSNASNPSGHRDAIEVYSGSNMHIRMNRITHPAGETAAINIAPWSGGSDVDNCLVEDNFIDGGNMHVVIDLQSSGDITNTRFKRNKFGGHTDPGVVGSYFALNNVQGRPAYDTELELAGNVSGILWSTDDLDPDRNTWDECDDLIPDRTGETVEP
jgi:hypothetical protein